jgi:hypothetical protein
LQSKFYLARRACPAPNGLAIAQARPCWRAIASQAQPSPGRETIGAPLDPAARIEPPVRRRGHLLDHACLAVALHLIETGSIACLLEIRKKMSALIALAVGQRKMGLLGPKTCEATTRHGRVKPGHDDRGSMACERLQPANS